VDKKSSLSRPISKIGARFKKYSTLLNATQPDSATELLSAESTTSAISVVPSKPPDSDPKLAEIAEHIKYSHLEVFNESLRLFETSHRLTGTDALSKIAHTLQNYAIEG
jgi:hypothetical protein